MSVDYLYEAHLPLILDIFERYFHKLDKICEFFEGKIEFGIEFGHLFIGHPELANSYSIL